MSWVYIQLQQYMQVEESTCLTSGRIMVLRRRSRRLGAAPGNQIATASLQKLPLQCELGLADADQNAFCHRACGDAGRSAIFIRDTWHAPGACGRGHAVHPGSAYQARAARAAVVDTPAVFLLGF